MHADTSCHGLPRVAFYGDDFTGTTDAMEALALAGLPTRMFLRPPTPPQVATLAAFGLAGSSRSMSPAEMDVHLPAAFAVLRDALPPAHGLFHYKLCSTFDSAPHIGSIGHAIGIARRLFDAPLIPLIVGAPPLGRYCCFGNLFARSGGDSDVYRLDRHPTMRRHPVTPMDEADLRVHLARQTDLPVRLIDFRALDDPAANNPLLDPPTRPAVVLFDVLHNGHLRRLGEFLTQAARQRTLPVFGSSGVEYALTVFARDAGLLPPPPTPPPLHPVPQLLVLSGSCSPVTARQLDAAVAAGFSDLPLDPDDLAAGRLDRAADDAAAHLRTGGSILLHTARGPDDPRIGRLRDRLAADTGQPGRPGEHLGRLLGRLLRELLTRVPLQRVVVTGGDTSFFVADELGLAALDVLTPVAPGSPLCRVPYGPLAGLELLFKGGQVGRDHLLLQLLHGTRP